MSGGLRYIRDNLVGAFQVMLGRQDGMLRIDASLDGFWRSFGAIALIAPFAILSLFAREPIAAGAPEPAVPLTGAHLSMYALALLVDWFTFPILFAFLAKPLGLSTRYVPFIVARNWAAVVIVAISAVPDVLYMVHLLPDVLIPYALLVMLAVSLRFSYMVTRTALQVSMAMALPVVVFDVLLSVVIWQVFARFN